MMCMGITKCLDLVSGYTSENEAAVIIGFIAISGNVQVYININVHAPDSHE